MNEKIDEIISHNILFSRLINKKDIKKNSSTSQNIVPEILFIIISIFSFILWRNNINSLLDIANYFIWLVLLFALISLAMYNTKTFLLPNRLIALLFIAVVPYIITMAISKSDYSIIQNSIIGGLILGGIPFLLNKLSSGSWIGAGDYKMLFVIGLLLGWEMAILFITILVIALLLIVAASTKLNRLTRIPTGYLWSFISIFCVLFGQIIIDAIF